MELYFLLELKGVGGKEWLSRCKELITELRVAWSLSGWLFACWFGIEFVQGGKWCYGVSRSR